MSVRAKIFLISFSLLALASLGGGLYIQSQLSTYLNDDINSNLQNHAKIAQKLFVDAGLNYENADFLADDLGEASGLRVTLVSSSGQVIGDSEIPKQDLASVENHSNRPEIIQAVNQGSGLSQRYSNTINTDMRYLAVKIPLESSEGVVRVAAPLSQINQALARVRYTVLGAVLVGFIGVIIVINPTNFTFNPLFILPILAAIFLTIRDVRTKNIATKSNSFEIIFITSLLITFFSGIGSLFIEFNLGTNSFIKILISSFFLTVAYIFSVLTVFYAPLSLTASSRYSVIIFGIIFGYLILGEVPNYTMLSGALVISLSGLFVIKRQKDLGKIE